MGMTINQSSVCSVVDLAMKVDIPLHSYSEGIFPMFIY